MRLLFLLLLPLYIFAKPTWFYNINKKNSNEIIGYGISKDLYEAKKYAIDEIAKTLNLEINSSTKIEKIEKDKRYSKNVQTNININSKSNLSNIKFLKIENIEDLWYVAASYRDDLIENIVKDNLKNRELKESKQNNYLTNSPLINSLNKTIDKKLNYELVLKNQKWYLKYGEFISMLNQEDFYKLFYDAKNEKIELKINKKSFEDSDLIYFNIKAKESGFITIFNIERYGKIGVLFENRFIDKSLIFPKINEGELRVVNPNHFPIKELYLVVFSKTKLDLNEFELVSDKLLDTNSLKFDKLIKFLDNKVFCSKQINISKGY